MKGKNGRKKYEQIRSEGGGGGPKWYEYYKTLIHMYVCVFHLRGLES